METSSGKMVFESDDMNTKQETVYAEKTYSLNFESTTSGESKKVYYKNIDEATEHVSISTAESRRQNRRRTLNEMLKKLS